MTADPLTLDVLGGTYCICRFDQDDAAEWMKRAASGSLEFLSVTRTADELSIVCPTHLAPAHVELRNDGWRCLRLHGPLDLSLTGVMLRLVRPLAEVGCPSFAVSTHDTDYVLVKDVDLSRALGALRAAGHVVHD